ncbi:uncharacterized protein [Primulina huaijiensis]
MRELCGSIEKTKDLDSSNSCKINKEVDSILLWIFRKYGDRILLKDSDRNPRSKKKTKKSSTVLECKQNSLEMVDSQRGPPLWDLSLGGDGFPKFLCDLMVEGLAKHFRCVGVDAKVPYSKRLDAKDSIDQALKQKRVLLTRDPELLRHKYLIENQLYKVKSLFRNERPLEVIETIQLKIYEDQLVYIYIYIYIYMQQTISGNILIYNSMQASTTRDLTRLMY